MRSRVSLRSLLPYYLVVSNLDFERLMEPFDEHKNYYGFYHSITKSLRGRRKP